MKNSFRLAVIALLVALCTHAAAQVFNTTRSPQGDKEWPVVKEGITVKVSPHVYAIPSESVPGVPNVGIVVGSQATMIIDPGMGRLSGEAVAREMAKVSRNTEVYVVTTHLHPEHTTGELAFPKAKIIRAAAEQKDIDESGMQWVNIFRKRSPERAEILKDAAFRKADELFEKEKTVDLGGVRVRLMYVGPAHTLGDTAFYVEEDKVLFPGDLAMKEIFPAFAMPQSSMRSWLTSLEMLERLKPAHVIGSHGDLADGSILTANRELLSALQARALTLKREGKTAEAAGKLLAEEFKAKYPAWDQPVRALSAVEAIYRENP
jgi:glyoxylase-like metal-dependent hydrolase (beta-lactamase superfamily II)